MVGPCCQELVKLMQSFSTVQYVSFIVDMSFKATRNVSIACSPTPVLLKTSCSRCGRNVIVNRLGIVNIVPCGSMMQQMHYC